MKNNYIKCNSIVVGVLTNKRQPAKITGRKPAEMPMQNCRICRNGNIKGINTYSTSQSITNLTSTRIADLHQKIIYRQKCNFPSSGMLSLPGLVVTRGFRRYRMGALITLSQLVFVS